MRPLVISVLLCVALYNLHQIAGLFGVAPSNIVSHDKAGDIHTWVIDQSRNGTADLQRIGINIAFAQLILVVGWFYVRYAMPFAVVMGFFFVLQAVQIVKTCNCTTAEHIDWIVLAILLFGAWKWGPIKAGIMKIAFSKWRT